MTKNQGYIYILKEDTRFALMKMSGNVTEDYITLLDYDDIQYVNVYFDSDIEKYLRPFDMDKFYQIPVKNPDRATINDVFNFLKKEK